MSRFRVRPCLREITVDGLHLKVLYFSWEGKIHHAECSGGQDFVKMEAQESRFTMVVADGVGSVKQAAAASEMICDAIIDQLKLSAAWEPSAALKLARTQFIEACDRQRGELSRDEYATTALVFSIDQRQFWAGLVGDGTICEFRRLAAGGWRREWELNPTPIPEARLGELIPLTSERWILCEKGHDSLIAETAFVILTDGFSTSIEDHEAYFNYLLPELERVVNSSELETFAEEFALYLEGHGFGDDDKTLAVIFTHQL
jgi:hypothetical protein